MRHIIIYTFVLSIIFISCTNTKEIDTELRRADFFMVNSPDSAAAILNSLNRKQIEKTDGFSKAYYYLLLTELKSKSEESLLPMDSLIGQSVDYFAQKGRKRLLAKSLYYKGKIWEQLGEPQQAIACYHRAINEAIISEKNDLLVRLHNALGNIYIDQDLDETALKAFQTAHYYSQKLDDKFEQFGPIRNIGMTYMFMDKLDSTYYYIQEASKYIRLSKDSTQFIDLIHNDLSLYYSLIGDNKKAFEYLSKVSKTDEKIQMKKGNLYLHDNQTDSARHYLNLCTQSNDIYVQTNSYQKLYQLEESLGNYQKANEYINLYQIGKDSIANLTQTSEIHAINHKHNIEVAVTKLESEYSMRIAWIIACSIIAIFILIIIYTLRDKEKKIKQEVQKKEILEKEKEISKLELQIANTQNSILKLKQEKKDISELQLELQKQVYMLQSKVFMAKPYFKQIKELGTEKKNKTPRPLTDNEIKELRKELHAVFADFIENLHLKCPSLTTDDLLFCCLCKLNIPLLSVAICLGSVDTTPVKQRKYRIKKKMTEDSNNTELYLMIFGENDSH